MPTTPRESSVDRHGRRGWKEQSSPLPSAQGGGVVVLGSQDDHKIPICPALHLWQGHRSAAAGRKSL